MLYLFDIDGTLVDTGGAGMAALEQATREISGAAGPPLDLAGATDLGIVIGIHEHFLLEPTRESIDAYLAIYQQRLDWNLAHGARACAQISLSPRSNTPVSKFPRELVAHLSHLMPHGILVAVLMVPFSPLHEGHHLPPGGQSENRSSAGLDPICATARPLAARWLRQ